MKASWDFLPIATQRLVGNKQFMELQCDLSRDAYGGRKHYDDAEGRETSGIKMMYGKRNRGNGDASKPHNREILEKDANVEEPIKGAHAEGFPSSQGSKMKNPLHRHPKSCTKNFKENEPQQKREVGCSKAALDATDVGGRMRRHKQQNSEQNHGSSLKLPQEIASQHNQQQSSLNQSVIRQSQRQVPKSISEKGKVEQCPRTLKRSVNHSFPQFFSQGIKTFSSNAHRQYT
eukprot:Gb_16925 [translate_table: standard]